MDSHESKTLASVPNCTRTPAALFAVECIAGASSRSITPTDNPACCNRKASAAPIMPAPITITSCEKTCACLPILGSVLDEHAQKLSAERVDDRGTQFRTGH